MNPPPGPDAPSVDQPKQSFPWNNAESMPPRRERSRSGAANRTIIHATGRGTTAPAARAARATHRSHAQPSAVIFDRSPSAEALSERLARWTASIIMAMGNTVKGVFERGTPPRAVGSAPSKAKVIDKRRRILLLLFGIVVGFIIILGQVVNLQVLDRQKYVAYGTGQRMNSQILAADRGNILDRNGAELVISRPARSVFVDPKLVTDAPAEAAALAPILGVSAESLQVKMTGKGRFAYLARKVPAEVADRVEELGLAGIAFFDESERYLPAGNSGRSFLGAVDIDNVGISGLESQFGDALTGTPGSLSLERSPSGRTIAVGAHSLTPAVKGQDVKLTIDRSIQFEAERLLGEQVRTSNAKGGVAIVSNPATGEVLAIANMVSNPETGEVLAGTNNAALTMQHEPGSVMKVLAIAGAIEDGKVSPSTVFDLPPTLKFYDDTFGEAEGRGTVSWDVLNILTHSSNIGTIKIGQALGKDQLYSFQKLFGFGAETGLGFPNETAGSVLSPSKYTGTSLPSIAIGQGISVTPMQMLFAYNTIANKGTYVPPKLVDSTVDASGVEHSAATGTTRSVVSISTADQMNMMLRSVVQSGTGQLAEINGYTVAGKTGTARKVQPGGGYLDKFGVTRYMSTFVGFVPAERPTLSVYVMLDEPTGDYYGGSTAGPVFSKLASFALNRLGIAPAATDGANNGVPVDGSQPTAPSSGQAVVTGDRVRALASGSPEALAASMPTRTAPPSPVTTVKKNGTTR